MGQDVINWILGGLGALIGFLLNTVWQSVKDLQTSDKEIAQKVASFEILVADAYVKKSEFSVAIKTLIEKLDKIEDKIDRKADKQ